MEIDTPEEVVKYLTKERTSQATLVFASKELKNQILLVAGFAEDLDDVIDHDNLKELDERNPVTRFFRILISCDTDQSMRGLNLRAPINGIKLLVCAPFAN